MSVELISVDAPEPVSLDECRDQCYIIGGDPVTDRLLLRLSRAARQGAESFTWLSIVPQTFEQTFRQFDDTLRLQRLPVISVESVQYLVGESYVTIPSNEYVVDKQNGVIEPIYEFPEVAKERFDAVKVRFSAGFEQVKNKQIEDIRSAILMHVKFLYDNRDAVMVSHGNLNVIEPPMGYKYLLEPHSKRLFV